MAGIPRPVTDLPAGHVSVRLIRGQLSNNIQGHPVEMHAGGKVVTVRPTRTGARNSAASRRNQRQGRGGSGRRAAGVAGVSRGPATAESG